MNSINIVIFKKICDNLIDCYIYDLSCVNKKFNSWVKKYFTIHNCNLLRTNLLKVKCGCIKFKNLIHPSSIFAMAAGYGYLYICESLIKKYKINIHIGNEFAFRTAAANGHIAVCKWLIQFSPNVHAGIEFAFRTAAANGHIAVCKWLLRFNPVTRNYAFKEAAANGHLNICKLLINNGADPHSDNYYAFKCAAENGHLAVCKWIIKNFKPAINIFIDIELNDIKIKYPHIYNLLLNI